MLNKYRLFQRANGVFYYQDNESGQQRSLWTKDRRAAEKLLHVKNEAHRLPTLNLTMARAYLSAHDVEMSTRTWAAVIKLEVHYVIPNVSSTPNIIHPPHAATLFQRRHLLKGLAVASQFPVALQFESCR